MALDSLGKARTRRSPKARVHHNRAPRVRSNLRIASNIGLILGQCLLLFVSRDIGLVVIISSSLLSFPFFLHERMWDVLLLMLFMLIINLTGLFIQ